MIHSLIHPGSGLGNQLFRIVSGKVLALDKGYEYSAIGRENFKGKDFMNIDFGPENNIRCHVEQPTGKLIPVINESRLWEEKTPYYNPEFNFIEDNTIIDGEFQDERYFGHRENLIDHWTRTEYQYVPDDVCVIGFRGGEFYTVPELGLPKSYFEEGIEIMKSKGITKFEVHTDDKELAAKFFPEYPIIQDISINWRSMRYAKNAIIANSSFYILPRLLCHPGWHSSTPAITIAPRYWDRYNIKKWERPYNYYKAFSYIGI